MWFSSFISVSNLGEKLDRNVEMRVLGCLISEKEKKKKHTGYIMVNLEYLRTTLDAIFPVSDCII